MSYCQIHQATDTDPCPYSTPLINACKVSSYSNSDISGNKAVPQVPLILWSLYFKEA